MMNEETKKALIHIGETGSIDDIEICNSGRWEKLRRLSYDVRIKPKRPIIAPEIWAVLPDFVDYIKWNDRFPIAYYKNESPYLPLMDFKGLYLNGCDWTDSKVTRP